MGEILMDRSILMQLAGRLISYYRLEKRNDGNKEFNATKFIKNDENIEGGRANICSNHTLVKIEDGILVNKECYYLMFADKLGFEFTTNRQLISQFNDLTDSIFFCINTMSKTKLEETLNKVDMLVIKCKNYIVFKDIIEVYRCLLKHLLNGPDSVNLSKSELIKKYAFISNFLDTKEAILYSYFAYLYYMYVEKNRKESIHLIDAIIDLYQTLQKNDALYLNMRIIQLSLQRKTLETYQYINKQLHSQDKKTLYLEYLLHYNLTREYLTNNPIKASMHIKKCRMILDCRPGYFPEYLLDDLNVKAGIIAYYNHDYKLSSDFFIKVLRTSPLLLKTNFLLLAKSLENIKEYSLLSDITKMYNENIFNWTVSKNIFTYYKLKYENIETCNNVIIFEREKALFLEKTIIRFFKDVFPRDTEQYQIISDELYFLNKFTGNNKHIVFFTDKSN